MASNSVNSAGSAGTLTIRAPPRTHERPQPGNGRTIIIEVLDHVRGQHGVTRRSDLAEGLSQVGLHQASARAVELLERPPGVILRRGLNETFPLSGDSGIRESNSARRSYFWFATQGGGRWLGVESILRKTSDESSMRNARAIPISWFGTRC